MLFRRHEAKSEILLSKSSSVFFLIYTLSLCTMADSLTLRCKRPTGLYSTVTILLEPQQSKTYYLTLGEAEEPLLQSSPNGSTHSQVKLGEDNVHYPIDVDIDSFLVVLGVNATLRFSPGDDLSIWLSDGLRFNTTAGEWIVERQLTPNSEKSHSKALLEETFTTEVQQEQVVLNTPGPLTERALVTPPGTSVLSASQSILALAEAAHQGIMHVGTEPTRTLRSLLGRISVRIKTPTQYKLRARNPFLIHTIPRNIARNADTIQTGGDENKENEPPLSSDTAHLHVPTPPSKRRKLLIEKATTVSSKMAVALSELPLNQNSDLTEGNWEAATKDSEDSSRTISKMITSNTWSTGREDVPDEGSHASSIYTQPVSSRVSTIEVKSSRLSRSVSPFKRNSANHRVCLSGSCRIPKKQQVIQSFRKLGGSIVKELEDATILCVSSQQPLTKTAKFLLAVATGVDIIYDKWLTQSAEQGRILPLADFIPEDEDKEREWQVTLEDAVSKGKQGLSHILRGLVVHITSSLQKELKSAYESYCRMAKALGADDVRVGLPSRRTRSAALIIGTANDVDVDEIAGLQKQLWSKDLLSMTILRGQLQTHDPTFRVGVSIKKEEEEDC